MSQFPGLLLTNYEELFGDLSIDSQALHIRHHTTLIWGMYIFQLLKLHNMSLQRSIGIISELPKFLP